MRNINKEEFTFIYKTLFFTSFFFLCRILVLSLIGGVMYFTIRMMREDRIQNESLPLPMQEKVEMHGFDRSFHNESY